LSGKSLFFVFFEGKYKRIGLQTLDIKRGESFLETGFGTGHCLAQITESVGIPVEHMGLIYPRTCAGQLNPRPRPYQERAISLSHRSKLVLVMRTDRIWRYKAHIPGRIDNMSAGIYKSNNNTRIELLEKSSVCEANKKFISSFADHYFTEGLSEHLVLKYISTLKGIALSIEVDFDEADENVIRRYIANLERSDKSEWTKHD